MPQGPAHGNAPDLGAMSLSSSGDAAQRRSTRPTPRAVLGLPWSEAKRRSPWACEKPRSAYGAGAAAGGAGDRSRSSTAIFATCSPILML